MPIRISPNGFSERHWLRPFDVVLARVNCAQPRDAVERDEVVQLRAAGQGLADLLGIARRDHDTGRIDDEGVDDVLGIQRRLEHGLNVAAAPHVAIRGVGVGNGAGRLGVHGTAVEVEPITALGEQHAGRVRQMHQAQRNHNQRDHQGHAEHLLLFQGQAHKDKVPGAGGLGA